MARRTSPPPPPAGPPTLVVPREEARAKITSRGLLGDSLLKELTAGANFEEWQRKFSAFNDYNRELLRRLFSTEEYASSYSSAGVMMVFVVGATSPGERMRDRQKELQAKIDYLATLAEKLDLIEAPPEPQPAVPGTRAARHASDVSNKRVFIVHGHDEEAKAVVARFLDRCSLDAVILHEEEDRGRTIIEKFEDTADVGFAVVLLTPDDIGGPAPTAGEEPTLQARARQNVVMELGYFIGRLGRSRVCALRKGDVELPSDISGVIYTPMTGDEGWKVRLAKELRAAGYAIDMNRVL